ncbi:serine--tRNA ligase [Candidatus Marinimicrobia bacterium MT.SAG.3]|nr:serine--tRNA ligase [Candidatus Marinimicrobia bacterium MT.SAG.3]
MLDLKIIRDNPSFITESISLKGDKTDIGSIVEYDRRRRRILEEVESLRALRNKVSEEISISKKNGEDTEDKITEMRELSQKIKAVEVSLRETESHLNEEMLRIPNIPHESVPKGKDSSDNKFVREWMEKPKYEFELKDHLELGEALGLLDFKRASKLSGSGFPLYMGSGAKLERSLINFMLDIQTTENGYKEVFPPFLVNRESALTTGQLPKFEEDMYKTSLEDLFLIPTAEVPVTNIHRDEILSAEELPICYAAYSACFRREAGSYGKDTHGFLRVHQFNKVELVKFCEPENSYEELEKIVSNAEEILKRLELHYRVVELSTGDLSFAAAKCYDIEVWAPGEEKYLEVSSCSNFEAFQARRGNIRYRKSDGKIDFVHTLNGSGLATSRLMVALLETHQTEEGTIHLPEALIPYFGESVIKNDSG